MRRLLLVVMLVLGLATAVGQQQHVWRGATASELEAVLPMRAPVEKERIETEMRTATGVIDEQKRIIASVVLITAGYSADGKYSHFLVVQAPWRLGELKLKAGTYVVGWTRVPDGLKVRIYDALTGVERGEVKAVPIGPGGRVESFRIWAPGEHKYVQIGRFMLAYSFE